jgi:hypothetical protein
VAAASAVPKAVTAERSPLVLVEIVNATPFGLGE